MGSKLKKWKKGIDSVDFYPSPPRLRAPLILIDVIIHIYMYFMFIYKLTCIYLHAPLILIHVIIHMKSNHRRSSHTWSVTLCLSMCICAWHLHIEEAHTTEGLLYIYVAASTFVDVNIHMTYEHRGGSHDRRPSLCWDGCSYIHSLFYHHMSWVYSRRV